MAMVKLRQQSKNNDKKKTYGWAREIFLCQLSKTQTQVEDEET